MPKTLILTRAYRAPVLEMREHAYSLSCAPRAPRCEVPSQRAATRLHACGRVARALPQAGLSATRNRTRQLRAGEPAQPERKQRSSGSSRAARELKERSVAHGAATRDWSAPLGARTERAGGAWRATPRRQGGGGPKPQTRGGEAPALLKLSPQASESKCGRSCTLLADKQSVQRSNTRSQPVS